MIVQGNVDAIVGLQYGDEGKGKVTAGIVSANNYDLTVRFNGGPNAGHTIVREDLLSFKLHQLPSSIAYNKPGYIAPGCVLNLKKLYEEIEIVEQTDPSIKVKDLLQINPNVPIIKDKHIELDANNQYETQGSTKQGIAPAYADFYNRSATLLKCVVHAFKYPQKTAKDILVESAQGFYLDPFNGSYPYTTSSHCLPAAAAATIGFDPKKFRRIFGVAKCYETRSGTDPNFYAPSPHAYSIAKYSDQLDSLVSAGREYGVTTGRQRKVRFLDLNSLMNASIKTGTTDLIINKWDVFQQIEKYSLVFDHELITFKTIENMKNYICNTFYNFYRFHNHTVPNIYFSSSPTLEKGLINLND